VALNAVGVGIAGMGAVVPEVVVTNHDLEGRMDTSDEWIRSKIGIVERRWVREDQAMTDLAIPAARQAIEQAAIDAREIELIIVAGSNHDYLMPATACLVQAALGADNAGAMDIKNACSGFVYALGAGAAFVQNQTASTVLVIGAEIHSKIIDQTDRTMAPFFGDGAGAVVLKRTRPGTGILSSYFGADGYNADAIIVPAGGSRRPVDPEAIAENAHLCHMDGKRVKAFIQRVFPFAIQQACRRAGHEVTDLDFVISHQANLHLIREGMENMGLPMSKTLTMLEWLGNSGAASVPTVLKEAVDRGQIRPGDLVATAGYGAGLAYGANLLRWAAPDDFLP
jgi:3-oxoacyl-[acyl-carrier-protein] synthase III